MTEEMSVTTERVDDVPILLALMQKLGVSEVIDESFPQHGNWSGLSQGKVTAIWLVHILSEADHRLNHVQAWSEKHLVSLCGGFGEALTSLDFTDDRLEGVLDRLGEDENWRRCEQALNQRALRVYTLNPQRVLLDTTTGSGYWTVSEEGLFQYGSSKDHRPDQPQIKVVLATLDPLGMPVVTQIVAGNRTDDPLYQPAIQEVRQSLGQRGLLYVGDSKLPSHGTRAFLQVGGDYYLAPLSKTQLHDEELENYLQPVWSGQQACLPILRARPEGQPEKIAEGFELEVKMNAFLNDQEITWVERRLVVRSFWKATSEQEALQVHLTKAEAALLELSHYRKGKRRYDQVEPLQKKAAVILQQYEVEGLLQISYEERSTQGVARCRLDREIHLQVCHDEAAIQKAEAKLGWRVYVTNAPKDHLSLEQGTLAYREEYQIEHTFGRLKGKPLSLSPMYLQDDRRATGLVRLLSIGLSLLTLMQYQVRSKLAQSGQKLAGLYAGNPKRATSQPTSELMEEAFRDITLSVIRMGEQVHYHLTPLSKLQQTILALLDFPNSIYTNLVTHFANSS